jgi:hypothetical protein
MLKRLWQNSSDRRSSSGGISHLRSSSVRSVGIFDTLFPTRDVHELLVERGLEVAYTTIWRWVQRSATVGKVFQALTDLGQFDDTVMLFTSDHGFFLGEWRMYDKRLMHEPSIRTPMLIRYPRMIRVGSTRKEIILNTDLRFSLRYHHQGGGYE